MIRRRVIPPRPSDWTPQAGRLFSPDAWVNRPLDPDPRPDGIARPVGWSCFPAGQVTVGPHVRDYDHVAIDTATREVATPLRDRDGLRSTRRISLDATDPSPSWATGLVLAREIAAAKVEHVVAVIGPWTVGTRLCAAWTGTEPSGLAEWALCAALFTYGAVCVEGALCLLDPISYVLVEEPPGGLGWPTADVGPAYRDVGIYQPTGTLPLALTPITPPRSRYLTQWWRSR